MSNQYNKRPHGRSLAAERREMGARLFVAAVEAVRHGNAAKSRNQCRQLVSATKSRSRKLTVERAAEMVERVQAVVWLTRRARRHRAETEHRPTAARWESYHRETVARELAAALSFFPSFGHLFVRIGNDEAITAHTETDNLGKYSSRCNYAKVERNGIVTLPLHGVRVDRSDGVVMVLRYRQAQRVGAVTATPGAIVSRRGYDLSAREAWLVRDDSTGMTAHGATRHAAMRALSAKRAAETRKRAPLTMDTILTPAAYQRITGACTEGTNDWLAEHGFTRSDRATVREVLALLDPSDYGRDKLARLVGA